jgi:hypothetical protein
LTRPGWVLGGAGIVGLGLGTAFGVMAIEDNDNARCNASKQCLPGPLSEARSYALASDISLIAGGLLLAGGAALVIFTPSGSSDARRGAVSVAPTAGLGSAGVALGGSW